MNMRHIASALVMLAAANAAQSQTIYRCGNEYTPVPCQEGRVVDAKNSVTAAQQAEAARVYERQRRLGDDMAEERRRNQAAIRPARAVNVGPDASSAASAASASLKAKKRARARNRGVIGDDFVAGVPKQPKQPKPPR